MPARKKATAKKLPTWVQLGKTLGVSDKSLFLWRKMEGAPQLPVEDEWRAYIDEKELGISGNKTSKGREHWLTLKAKNETTLQSIKIAKEKGQAVSIESVDTLLSRVALSQKTLLYDLLENQMPHRLTGKTSAEIRKILRKAADDVCAIMQTNEAKWKKDLKTTVQTD